MARLQVGADEGSPQANHGIKTEGQQERGPLRFIRRGRRLKRGSRSTFAQNL